MFNIKPIRQKTIVEQALNEIKILIEKGDLKPGDQVPTEDELAENFGISKQSIREAIKVFNYLEIFNTEPGKGTFVNKNTQIANRMLIWSIILSKTNQNDLIKVREIIERRGIRNIIKNRESEFAILKIQKLEKDVMNIKKAIEINDDKMRTKADYEFHETLIEGTNNDLFLKIYETYQYFMERIIDKTQKSTPDTKTLISYHENILESLKNSDEKKAIAALSQHMDALCWREAITKN